jgi:hypothetical protein
VDLIQMRNLNLDPELYLAAIGFRPRGRKLGVRGLMERLRGEFPALRFGYFNPPLVVRGGLRRRRRSWSWRPRG